MNVDQTVRHAAELIFKGMQVGLSPANDTEYRELLARYTAEPEFRSIAGAVAAGFRLKILDVTESRGIIVSPESSDSRFAMRLSDLRQLPMSSEQKAAVVLAHIAIAAQFFPTTDAVDDDNYVPPPASVAHFRDALQVISRRMKDSAKSEDNGSANAELRHGCEYIAELPTALPDAQRVALNSVVGIIRFVLRHLSQHGLVRAIDPEGDDETENYTPTHRFRVQLREIALRRIFEFAQTAVQQE